MIDARVFAEQGYVVARRLVSVDEAAALCVVELESGPDGGPCGEWVEADGKPVIELTGYAVDPRTTE